ncbi:prepilin peptidase [Candidatus Kuenenbacteria bacterium]|nr:prepilin peptidase [Candidatus Kuenenbacteria bacterium]
MLILIPIFVIGLCIGSFLNVVICRLPEKESIVKSRSNCPHCKENLKAQDLIPLLSFLILKGKCRQCKKKISWQYPLVEFATAALFVFLAWHYNLAGNLANPFFYRDLIFVVGLVVIFTTDLRFYLILDAVSLPLAVFAFIINFFLLSNSTNYLEIAINLIIAGIIGAGFFWIQYYFSKGKWVGGGDIRLGMAMGFILGWPNVLVALLMAYIGGAIISLILLATKVKKMKSQVPFGVFLTAATFIVLIWGNQILDWYLSLLL